MNKIEAIFVQLLESVGCAEVVASRYADAYKPYDLQKIRMTDNNEKNRQRRPMTPIPDFHPHPTEKHEYWDWLSERAAERWQKLADKAQEREEQRKEQREEVIRQAEEAWGETPMITLRGIHKAEKEEAEQEQSAEARVSKERESVEPFNIDAVRSKLYRNKGVSKLFVDLLKILQQKRRVAIIGPFQLNTEFEAATRQVFSLRNHFKRVMTFSEDDWSMLKTGAVMYPDISFDEHVTNCLREIPAANTVWIKIQKHLAEEEDDDD